LALVGVHPQVVVSRGVVAEELAVLADALVGKCTLAEIGDFVINFLNDDSAKGGQN
jgi:hypothetical protein